MALEKPKVFGSREEAPADAGVIDAFSGALEELFFIEHPNLKKAMPEAKAPLDDFLKNNGIKGIWIYFPWKNAVVRTLPEELYFKLRTARNRHIIREEEQKNYRAAKAGIAGLSVGSGVFSALVISGGPKTMKIADFDVIEVTNLNRIRANLLDVGQNKTEVAAKQIWELDPFADLYLYDKGLNRENLEEFILGGAGSPRLDIFIDEMDSLDLKVLARLVCKKNKVPTLMATDNGDGIILDIERFDLEPERPIFHGLVGEMKAQDLQNLDFKKWLELATKIVGPTYLTERMKESLPEIGKSIAGVPQLGSTAALSGAAVSLVARRLANGYPTPSGRYLFDMEEKMQEFINKFGNK